jgi:hypothetical protein
LPKRGGVGRAVLVFSGFYFFTGFVGRNNPLKPAGFGHGAEEEVRIAGQDRQGGTEKIGGGGGVGLLCFPFLDLFRNFVHAGLGRAQTSDRLRVLLDQAEERDVLKIGRDTNFDNRFRLMLLGRVKLGEARPQNVSLQKVPTSSRGSLLHLILDQPDFRPVIPGRVADKDNLEERFVGFEFDWMMELGNEGAQFFEEGDADLLEILFGGAFRNSVGIDGAEVRNVAVEPDWAGLRGDLPFGGAEENGDMAAVNGGHARGNGFGFERVIDGGEDDGIIGDVDDGAAAGEIRDDFLILGEKRDTHQECCEENQRGGNDEVLHEGRVAQRADCRLSSGGGMVPE